MAEVLWNPSCSGRRTPRIVEFQRYLAETHGLRLPDYDDLWTWSTDHHDEFWAAIWDYFGLDRYSSRGPVLGGEPMPRTKWFPEASINFAQYLLDQGADHTGAIIAADESGSVSALSRGRLRADTAALMRRLAGAGVGPGDVVAGYLPNIAETVIAFLATVHLGAIWSSLGQDYAWPAVVARFGQLAPTVLVTADGYRYGGKPHSRRDEINRIRAELATVRLTIVVSRLGSEPPGGCESWEDALAAGQICPEVPSRAVGFNDPLWVLFSSGTTGLPKGLVHGHGGILLETLKQMALHWDLDEHDVVFWYTSPSWVMWNLLTSTLAVGATIVVYDGAPTWPDRSVLWRTLERHGVTYFGTSPGFLQICRSAGIEPGRQFDLARLRSMGTTGSPLPRDVHRWARDSIADIPLWSISGGTDVAGAFVGGVPTVPVWAGELSARCLGVAVDAWDDDGVPVRGSVGEMVIAKSIPSMPLRLWDDDDYERYTATYFSRFPGVWRQGDWITITERGSVVIHGRSDSTLNRNGVRMGSADIYAAAEALPEIQEALVLGVEGDDGGYWMPLFVTLTDPGHLDDELVSRIKAAIRTQASPRHVPDVVLEVPGLPHTRTGKRLEVPIKRILQGVEPSSAINFDTVDEPAFLGYFVELAHARSSAIS
jgi:acetoacetyl-CoA synthetase